MSHKFMELFCDKATKVKYVFKKNYLNLVYDYDNSYKNQIINNSYASIGLGYVLNGPYKWHWTIDDNYFFCTIQFPVYFYSLKLYENLNFKFLFGFFFGTRNYISYFSSLFIDKKKNKYEDINMYTYDTESVNNFFIFSKTNFIIFGNYLQYLFYNGNNLKLYVTNYSLMHSRMDRILNKRLILCNEAGLSFGIEKNNYSFQFYFNFIISVCSLHCMNTRVNNVNYLDFISLYLIYLIYPFVLYGQVIAKTHLNYYLWNYTNFGVVFSLNFIELFD